MDRYTTLRSFVLVADCGSFAAAAHKENVTPVVMGRRLDALERHLGVKLMHRSTRGLSLTDLGEQYLERARGLLKDFDEVDASISHDRTSVRGHLVVSAPAAFGRRHIGRTHRRSRRATRTCNCRSTSPTAWSTWCATVTTWAFASAR